MIRTKAKNILLTIMLLLACVCLFACKDETEVRVESISFTETSISLLVGEEYSPQVKLTPSYANMRSYTLISSDTTALEVDGGSIIALKAIKGVKLKAVSDNNENANDVISVDIYDEAIQLETPTELKFNGDKFTFVGKDNVNAYVLKINETEINIGNNTEYSFDSVIAKMGDLHNEAITCSIKAVGDGKIFTDSSYSEPIEFVKISGVKNMYIENEILHFDAIKDVHSFDAEVLSKQQVVYTGSVVNFGLSNEQLSLDLSELTDSVNGAEYIVRVTPNLQNYNNNIEVFGGQIVEIAYNVIGSVKNVALNDRVLSWDFVKNAQNYTIEVYKDGELLQSFDNITNNYLQVDYADAGEYYCEILANSNNANTTTGKAKSNTLYFDVLEAPQIVANNNTITWNTDGNSVGYLVTIKGEDGEVIADRKFVLTNEYDITLFSAGKYSIEVMACGNGENGQANKAVLSSKVSEIQEWTILSDLEFKIENKALYWQDNDANTLHKYNLKFDTIDIVLTDDDLGEQYQYNEETSWYSYDLSDHDFEPNTYTISVQNFGENNTFSATANTLSITKLQEGSISNLQNKQFVIDLIDKAESYKVEVYASGDMTTPILELTEMVGGNKFDLDDTLLQAGNYVAKVFVYGNEIDVFDADNLNEGTTILFEKLSTPSINVDADGLKLIIDKDDAIKNENKYGLREGNTNIDIEGNEYSVASVSEGDHTFGAKAFGNNSTILDSDWSIVENEVKVKRIATPTMTFDKSTLTYTISCTDDEYVESYTFILDEDEVPVINHIADCSALIVEVKDYHAKLSANAPSVVAGYNLVLDSAVQESIVGNHQMVTKLDGVCDFEIANGKLIVTPSVSLTGGGYNLSLRIDNAESDIVLTGFNYTNSRFEKTIYDNKYNPISDIQSLMAIAGRYDVYTTISKDSVNVVTSDEVKADNTINVIGRVSGITKNEQTIEFGLVDDAINYQAVVKVSGAEHCIDIKDKYTTDTNNVLTIDDLIQLMEVVHVPYKEQTDYNIKFVAVNEDVRTIANKSVDSYTFQFLKTPVISIVEQGSNTKYLAINNNDVNATNYRVIISQSGYVQNEVIAKQNDTNTIISMDEIVDLVAGNVNIEINSMTTTGNYFESKYATMVVNKLGAPEIKVVNGELQWEQVNNAKQYNLAYSNATSSGVIVLAEGSENFTISGGICVYNFETLESGLSSFSLQIDSMVGTSGAYYLNSNSGERLENIYKLPTIEVGVVNGYIYTEVRVIDVPFIDTFTLMVDGRYVSIDVSQESDDVKINLDANKMAMTINPHAVFTYGSNEMIKETLSLKLYAGNDTTLNSSTFTKDFYGLLSPTNLDITTSSKVDDNGSIEEVLEKITWNNPASNGEHVSKYKVVINYNETDYVLYNVTRALMMPKYFDENENGLFDAGEVEFGAGVYKIKVQALTNNCENILNSKYCGEIEVTILGTPTNLSTKEGNIIWSNDTNVEYYLVKVYLLEGAQKTLIASGQSLVSEFDLCTLSPLETGVYGVSVQAMHNHSRILASYESDILQVIRLPQVATYYVQSGEFYFRAHAFYTKAEIYLTSKEASPLTINYKFTMYNENPIMYNMFVNDPSFKGWASSNVLDTYTNSGYFMDVKYKSEGSSILHSMLAEGCSVSIKLFGNTSTDSAIISGHANDGVVNEYLYEQPSAVDKNSVEKLVTPIVQVSETQRGMVLISIPKGINYNLKYARYMDFALQGVHLYQINILTDQIYSIVVADIIDEELLLQSLEEVGGELIVDESKNNIKYIEYLGLTINVVDKNADGKIELNFNSDYYYYYTLEGEYTYVDLTIGGSFVVNSMFLGDDTQFVTSSPSDIIGIKRYKVLNLEVGNGSMSWLNQATEDDHPIYLVTLNNNLETYNLVLYNPEVYTEEQVLGCLEIGKTYILDTLTYGDADERITYNNLANIVNNIRIQNGSGLVGMGGTFLATVKAHYTDVSSMDIVLAQGAETKTVSILPKSTISVVNGKLTWDMAYVTNSGGKDYATNYLLEIFDGGNKLYEIILGSEHYDVLNYVATLELQNALSDDIAINFDFVENNNYIFKITALGGDSSVYINSVSTQTQPIKMMPQLQNFVMTDGIITWTNSTPNDVEIHIVYMLGDTPITLVINESDNQFELPAAVTDVNQTLRELIAGYNYLIRARVKGDSSSINSYFSGMFVTQRMATVDKNTMVTNNGVLTWQANPLEDTRYTIVYTLEDGTTSTTEKLDTNSYDFGGLASGIITAQIYTHHYANFTSFISESVQLYKLSQPTNIVYEEGSTTISWDKVVDNNGEYVDTYKVQITQDGYDPVEYICLSNEWIITGVASTAFRIAVKAISLDESGAIINSDYTEPQSMSLPNQVDVETFEFDDEIQAFKWKAIEGEQAGDKYYIGYSYYETILSDNNNPQPTEIEYAEVIQTQIVDGEKYYYYYPSKIGSYRLIYVQVVRAGSLSSQQTWCMDEGNVYYALDFDLFTSGHGTLAKPYIISNEKHLRNIKYFLGANYELDSNITLASNEPITDASQVFTGVINGNSYYINGAGKVDIHTLNSSGYVGLFNKTRNATFNAVSLSNFAINGYVNSANVYMGILVGYAESTTFTNITLSSSTINVVKSSSIGYVANNVNVYIGSIVGYALNSQFKNCVVNLGGSDANVTIVIQGNSQTKVSFGGFVGYVDECSLTNNTNNKNAFIISITLTISGGSPVVNVGSLVGEAGANGSVLTGNDCTYLESISGSLVEKTNQIGKQN